MHFAFDCFDILGFFFITKFGKWDKAVMYALGTVCDLSVFPVIYIMVSAPPDMLKFGKLFKRHSVFKQTFYNIHIVGRTYIGVSLEAVKLFPWRPAVLFEIEFMLFSRILH